mmetsp:Transcript_11787/g.32816  ORF Transcript_11787/g.32816 Transcript_11787/m.32816 type:complete len:198 (-) Transcript_11787:787-1380(-)
MSDSMETIDDELKTSCNEIRRCFEDYERNKVSIAPMQCISILNALKKKLDTTRPLFQKYKIEMRDLSRDQAIAFEQNLREYAQLIDNLNAKVAAEISEQNSKSSNEANRLELLGPADQSRKNLNTSSTDAKQLIKDANSLQSESKGVLNHVEILVSQTEEVGVNTNIALKSQTQQMTAIKDDVDKVQVLTIFSISHP